MTVGAPGEKADLVALQRRLPDPIDPLACYAALSADGTRPDTALFEREGGTTLLMARAAVRIACRGEQVVAEALNANGRTLLTIIASRLADRMVESSAEQAVFRFPRPTSLDAEARLLAPSPLDVLRAVSRLATARGEQDFAAMAFGVVAFDYAAAIEGIAENDEDPLGFPDYLFWVPDALILFDPGATPRLLCTAFAGGDPAEDRRNRNDAADRLGALIDACAALPATPPPVEPVEAVPVEPEADLDDAAFMGIVSGLRERIAAGEIYQIVPSRTFWTPCTRPLRAFAALRQIERSPYRFFVRASDLVLLGASPETSVRVYREENWPCVEVRPIAGTRARGGTPDEDDRLEAEMRLDEKEVAEHMMLVDLARNDVARISIPGTRRVARLLTVERYARVMHLVSSVTGRLAIGFDALDALAACLNVGTLSGAPKLRATELLRATERTRRGPYGGGIGWLNGAGQLDTAVVIRSALVRDGTAFVRAGAGVVYDSDPQAEADETRRKASALLSILAAVEARP